MCLMQETENSPLKTGTAEAVEHSFIHLWGGYFNLQPADLWPLLFQVLPHDELMETKRSHRQSHRKKVLPEIYLTRLLSTKVSRINKRECLSTLQRDLHYSFISKSSQFLVFMACISLRSHPEIPTSHETMSLRMYEPPFFFSSTGNSSEVLGWPLSSHPQHPSGPPPSGCQILLWLPGGTGWQTGHHRPRHPAHLENQQVDD